MSCSGIVFSLNSSAHFNTRHKTCTRTQTLSTASRPYCEGRMHASSLYLSMHASFSYLEVITMHLPFFRLMRSLSTLRIAKLVLAGKTTQLGVSSSDRGPAFRWHYTSRTSSDTFRNTPSATFMLHVFFHHSFVIHTLRFIHSKKQQRFKYCTTWNPFCWSQQGLAGHWLP